MGSASRKIKQNSHLFILKSCLLRLNARNKQILQFSLFREKVHRIGTLLGIVEMREESPTRVLFNFFFPIQKGTHEAPLNSPYRAFIQHETPTRVNETLKLIAQVYGSWNCTDRDCEKKNPIHFAPLWNIVIKNKNDTRILIVENHRNKHRKKESRTTGKNRVAKLKR